jgi:hypothetical protein
MLMPILSLLLGCTRSPPEPPVAEPQPTMEEPVTPSQEVIGAVMAIAVELDAADRRSTRDPQRIQAVLGTLGDPASWTEGGPSRCLPHLWIRFVPPSAEGGATVIFCQSDSRAAISLPGVGSRLLPEPASRLLFDAALPISRSPDGPIAPVAVSENLATLLLDIGIRAASDAPGLRGVTLGVGAMLEPDALWPDGSPVTASRAITAEAASAAVEVLTAAGFFARASRYHAPATDPPDPTPPSDSEPAPPPEGDADGWLGVTVQAGAWHRSWRVAASSSELRWFGDRLAALESLSEVRPELESLLEQLPEEQ